MALDIIFLKSILILVVWTMLWNIISSQFHAIDILLQRVIFSINNFLYQNFPSASVNIDIIRTLPTVKTLRDLVFRSGSENRVLTC